MTSRFAIPAVVFATLTATPALADYPVGGSWTYEKASEKGRAESCGRRNMKFDGNMRYDTGSGAPEYKNISSRVSGQDMWTVVDEFFTGMMRGRVTYTLHIVDPDHIKLTFERGGSAPMLRRCG